ncbi:Guanyl-specific ribonuclease F1-like protein 1 [Colletotrichum truncatum]|uniref:Guanyl-specific ribonuclease F1-like protein 1 n=1 Tax=Colletotrichum truncatum TaxID=5467 RepID=A0ACC3ZCX5_COLTU|nr:Guanyl-specific ribonuclease F1-like protein 1 [Colletotrichum truncatum]KAF6797939.1 Guanyl-specific ribonuclease F1-like protein 1 [Colletotrichum truncatum]
MQLSLVLVSLFALAAQAAPAELQKRATTCGSTYYSTAQVNAAASAACNHVRAGSQAGSSTYPHRYNNYEGFNFAVSGPWYEFPIRSSGVYTGGSPGADRVVINGNCGLAGAITHTGASGNNFVGCSGTS